MRIRVLLFFFSLGYCKISHAQSDIKLMLKQIALIAVHVKELEKAIEIARDGLTVIHEIKNGEFKLHNIFILNHFIANRWNRVLPNEDFFWHFCAEITRARTHITVRQFEPCSSKSVRKFIRVLEKTS